MKYLFKCEDAHIFELDFKMAEERPEPIVCPKCKKTAHRYISSATEVIYNGTGWTTTDIPRKSGLEDYVS